MPLPAIIGLGGLLTSVIGGGKAAKGAKEQAEFNKEITQAQMQEKVDVYQHNIGQTQKDIASIQRVTGELVGDIQREGRKFTQEQSAALGASGATIGSGTPLDTLIETEASIQRDILRTETTGQEVIAQKQSEIGFMEEQVGKYGSLMDELFPKPTASKIGLPTPSTRQRHSKETHHKKSGGAIYK